MNMNKDLAEKREKKVTKMVFLMVFAFIGAWSGYAFLCILRLLGVHSSELAFGLVMFAAKSGGWLNTLVFIFMNTQVSNYLAYIVTQICSRYRVGIIFWYSKLIEISNCVVSVQEL